MDTRKQTSAGWKTSRRGFFAGAAAFAASSAFGGVDAASIASVYENADGSATDCVLARRLYLDLAGRIPTAAEARAFVDSTDPEKRAKLVDGLLGSEDFNDFWTMRLADILCVKSEFPINLWPNAVYAFHRRIRAFVATDETWDHFATDLLTARGSDFRDGASNFFRALNDRTPQGWAENSARVFLGEDAAAEFRDRDAGYFSSLRIKDTREWKEEIVLTEGTDRRPEYVAKLLGPRRRRFEDAFARRVNTWLFGEYHPSANEAAPGVLSLRARLRSLVLSREYAEGSVTGNFPVRRLDAEVLDDALAVLAGSPRDYQSPAPEPFTFLPPDRRTVCIEDGSVSSSFLSLFGRPSRDTGLAAERSGAVTAKQRLYLFNSGKLHGQLAKICSAEWRRPSKTYFRGHVENLYWTLLGRRPVPRETDAIMKLHAKVARNKGGPGALLKDVAWCIVNTREFLFRI